MTTQETPLSRAERMKKVLKDAFAPSILEIEDQSARHAGHAGAREGGETHYKVRMTAEFFNGLSRVQRQRAVNDALAIEFAQGLHALSLELRAPQEDR